VSRSQEHLEGAGRHGRAATPSDVPLEDAQPTAGAIDDSSPFLGVHMSLPREIIFLLLITSTQLLTQAALGQNIAPLHVIGASFGVSDAGQLSWTAAAYSLTGESSASCRTQGQRLTHAARSRRLHPHRWAPW
jgi:hypothetical protein